MFDRKLKTVLTIVIMIACAFVAGKISMLGASKNDTATEDTTYSTIQTIESKTEPQTETIADTTSEVNISEYTEALTEILTENTSAESADEYNFADENYVEYHFRNKKLLTQHFEKHGAEFDDIFRYPTAQDYEEGASDVINNPDALYKTESEDGDGVYYIESTNEFVVLSKDGYIRTYFRPSGGKKYFDKQ